MTTRAATEYRYEKLTWPEINDTIELGKVCIVPCGAIKGRLAYNEAVQQLLRFIQYFKNRPVDLRRDHHRKPPTMPMPWGQRSI